MVSPILHFRGKAWGILAQLPHLKPENRLVSWVIPHHALFAGPFWIACTEKCYGHLCHKGLCRSTEAQEGRCCRWGIHWV
jgi:hypothetical protein